MGIRFACPNGHRLNVKNYLAGKRGICPDCGAKFTIPSKSLPNFEKRSPHRDENEPTGQDSAGQDSTGQDPARHEHSTRSPKVDAKEPRGNRNELNATESISAAYEVPTAVPLTTVPVTTPLQPRQSFPEPMRGPTDTVISQPLQSPAPSPAELTTGGLQVVASSDTTKSHLSTSATELTEWFVQIADGQRFGPADTESMRVWIDEGRIAPDNLVHQRGWSTWKIAAEVFPEIVDVAGRTEVATDPASESNYSAANLALNGTSRTDKYRGRQAAKSRLFAIVAMLGVTCILLIAALIYVIQR